MTLYRGDDFNAFGKDFIEITLDNPNEFVITKAIFQCGIINKVFNNPIFPLNVTLTKEETRKLQNINTCYLALYDEDGLKETVEGTITFETHKEVVND